MTSIRVHRGGYDRAFEKLYDVKAVEAQKWRYLRAIEKFKLGVKPVGGVWLDDIQQ